MATRIGIVGAGFSGTMVAVHLLRELAQPGTEILLFERGRRFARGVAYGTLRPFHLLNVPAARMSAFEEAPDDFIAFLRQREPNLRGGAFVARSLYGDYLATLLDQAERSGFDVGVRLRRLYRHVVDVTPTLEGFRLASDEGPAFDVSHLVLALGNLAPRPLVPEPLRGPWYVGDPWAEGALDDLPAGPILLLGTGLTMLDVALSISAVQPQARLLALSRRGLVAQAHRHNETPPPARARPRSLDSWPRTARGLLRGVRAEVAAAAQRGVDWRAVVSSLRADTAALWQALPEHERARFLARLRPYWDIHRHRSAPETAEAVQALVRKGRLVLRAGQVAEYRPADDGQSVLADVRLRGGATVEAVRAVRVVNCTGPESDLHRLREPLVRSLLASGRLRPDALGLGIDTEEGGAVRDARGSTDGRLFAVGPLCKARDWEHVAVPELRIAARTVARQVAASAMPAFGSLWSYG